MKCLACGNVSVVGGNLIETSGGGSVAFKLDDVPAWKSLFGVGTRPVRAYGCVHCRHCS
jgi:hypothetical protein